MDLNALSAFVAVVEEGGFTAAAASLGTSKSRVSQRVKALEEHLGTRLLHRTTRQVQPTDAGFRLFEKARAILAAAEEAEREVLALGSSVVGKLRVSAPSSFGRRFLTPVIARLGGDHPALEMSIQLTDRWVDLVAEGFDVAVRVGRLPESGLVVRRVGGARLLLVGAPSYVKERGAPAEPPDLDGHNCLRFAHQQRPDVWSFGGDETNAVAEDVRVWGSLVSNDGELLAQAAIAGVGLAWLPDFIVGDALASGELVQMMDERCVTVLPVHVVFPERKYRPQKDTLFAEALAAHLKA